MGDKATLAKARQELEDLYLGVPDESVNLTFKDFVNVQQQNGVAGRKKLTMEPIQEKGPADGLAFRKSPSLDFTKGLETSTKGHRRIDQGETLKEHQSPRKNNGFRNSLETILAYDDVSVMRGGLKRQGIPHVNVCTICSVYIYIFRHRCLVCGRVYCRKCVSIGMGEMTEGRKCIECLGRRFSQRYIQKAGNSGCCVSYPSRVTQQELKWAEKGPRRNGERRFGMSGATSRSRSPVMPRTPTRMHISGSPTSFVLSGTYSPTVHHLPL